MYYVYKTLGIYKNVLYKLGAFLVVVERMICKFVDLDIVYDFKDPDRVSFILLRNLYANHSKTEFDSRVIDLLNSIEQRNLTEIRSVVDEVSKKTSENAKTIESTIEKFFAFLEKNNRFPPEMYELFVKIVEYNTAAHVSYMDTNIRDLFSQSMFDSTIKCQLDVKLMTYRTADILVGYIKEQNLEKHSILTTQFKCRGVIDLMLDVWESSLSDERGILSLNIISDKHDFTDQISYVYEAITSFLDVDVKKYFSCKNRKNAQKGGRRGKSSLKIKPFFSKDQQIGKDAEAKKIDVATWVDTGLVCTCTANHGCR